REDHGVSGNAPLDRDEGVLVGARYVVVVRDEDPVALGRRRNRDQVAAPAGERAWLVPDLLRRAREQGNGVDPGSLRGALELLHVPGVGVGGRLQVALRERELLPTAASRGDRGLGEGDGRTKRFGPGRADLPPDLAMGSGDAQERNRFGWHRVGS